MRQMWRILLKVEDFQSTVKQKGVTVRSGVEAL